MAKRTRAGALMRVVVAALALAGGLLVTSSSPAHADIADPGVNSCSASNLGAAFAGLAVPQLVPQFIPPGCATQPVDCGAAALCDFGAGGNATAVVGRASMTVLFQGHLSGSYPGAPQDGWVDLDPDGHAIDTGTGPGYFSVASCTKGSQVSVNSSCKGGAQILAVPSGNSLANHVQVFGGLNSLVAIDRYRALCVWGPITGTEVVLSPSVFCIASATPHVSTG